MNDEALEISVMPKQELAASAPGPAPLLALIEKVINGGVTESNVAALDKLLAVYERLDDKRAEREFSAAFVALQAEMPSIEMSKIVPDRNGGMKFRFAPFEDIMHTVKPLLQKNGFTVTFSMDFKDGRIVQSCTLQHIGGHSRTNQFMARVGNGPPGASECQADGAASTYAKRFALCNALNIVTEVDTDGRRDERNEGAPIAPDKAMYLRELVRETKSDEAAFLKFAGASTYEEIGSERYDRCVAALAKKRSQ